MSTERTPGVVVVDYGLGNLRSVTRGLERAGADVTVTAEPGDLHAADGVVLPGVGAFREGAENAASIRAELLEVAETDVPLFGICLGMQLLLSTSEEGAAGESAVRGLDLIPGTNVRFSGDRKVPQMGWNDLSVERAHPLVEGVDGAASGGREGGSVDGEYAYFVHSYYARPDDESAVVATSTYGVEFPAVVADESGTVFGTQFHPEKSGDAGLRILRNFVDLCRS